MILIMLLFACKPEAQEPVPTEADTSSFVNHTGYTAHTGSTLCAPDHARETWQTFGQGFLSSYCQGCHGSLTPDRVGAPPSVVFDTEEQAWQWADRILLRATGPEADMPPAGGPPPELLNRLQVWLLCEEPPKGSL